MDKYNSAEFYNLVKDYYYNEDVQNMKNYKHHGIDRLDHCLRVAYYTYLITKFLRLNDEEATIAAMLHDFFLDEVKDLKSFDRYRKHPSYAVLNSKKHFCINEFQEDSIKKHMFPLTIIPPKYIEGWIIDIVDDFASVYERCYSIEKKAEASVSFIFILILGLIK